jgi:hypothetical protein
MHNIFTTKTDEDTDDKDTDENYKDVYEDTDSDNDHSDDDSDTNSDDTVKHFNSEADLYSNIDVKDNNIDVKDIKLDDIKDKSDDNDVDVNICNKINLKKYKYSEDEIKILMQRFEIETYNLKTLFRHFQHKCRKLNQSKSILELKYKKYKWCHNFWNIGIIAISSILTLIESSKLVFIDNESGSTSDIFDDELFQKLFILSPIFLGTVITGSSSIIKFKKYQEHMEEIYILIDKCIGMLAKIKNKKDEIDLLKKHGKKLTDSNLYKEINHFNDEVKNISNFYKSDIIKEYLIVYQDTERYIDFKDYDKYLHTIHNSDYKRHVLYKNKNMFYKEYDIKKHKENIGDKYFKKIKEKSMNGKSNIKTSCC